MSLLVPKSPTRLWPLQKLVQGCVILQGRASQPSTGRFHADLSVASSAEHRSRGRKEYCFKTGIADCSLLKTNIKDEYWIWDLAVVTGGRYWPFHIELAQNLPRKDPGW
ncbi:hypothetical protein AV530_004659 [Patagioenas fasciata monilis]|uniref:Uncharacterized protein n=1 Tax=Patagioenas fasciata monilis TaxID=372326 RepID=A0A1V4KHN9_PATFA|nr:hypothetical protein AV530_004659 [Patagioenas fasciata monilis]